MRKIAVFAAIAILAAAPALAQEQQRHVGGAWGHGGPGFTPRGAQPQQAPQRHEAPRPAPQAAPQRQAAPQQRQFQHADRGGNRFGGAERQPGNRQPGNNGFRPDNRRPDNRSGYYRPGNRPEWRGPGYGGPRHDFSSYRDFHRNFQASRRFRGPDYRRPAGWYDHRWVFGEFLPSAFWARDYWLDDFAAYDLPPPPYGAVWVRVGNDALLIDQDSGEVITVEYGVFY